MIQIRVLYTDKDEKREALKVVRRIVRAISKRYEVSTNMKVYRNKRNTGGRIYLTVKKTVQ